MQNKELLKNMANDYIHEGDCFIHTEMKNGKTPETILAGDFLGIAWGIMAEINRLSELTHTTFEETVALIFCLRQEGYKSIRNKMGNEPFELKQGEDWQEEWKKAETKRVEQTVRNKDVDIANLNDKIKTLEKIIQAQRENADNIRKEADKRVQMANKNIRKLEHEIRDLIERQKRE